MTTRVTAGRYTRVGEKKGPLAIGGAEKRMNEDPSFIYVPLFRVAGTKEDVETWLTENHPERQKEALKGCYSASNLKKDAIREAFDRELERSSEARISASASKAEMKQVNLMVLVKLLKMYDEQKRNGLDTTTAKTVSDLKAKVKVLVDEGKVLDITNMKAKGTDGKKMTMKDNSTKRRLSQQESDPFYHVVYNPKSKQSVGGVKNFLKAYGGFEADKIENLVKAVSDGSVVNISRGKSPTRSPMLSPSRRARDKKTTRGGKAKKEELDDLLDDLE